MFGNIYTPAKWVLNNKKTRPKTCFSLFIFLYKSNDGRYNYLKPDRYHNCYLNILFHNTTFQPYFNMRKNIIYVMQVAIHKD